MFNFLGTMMVVRKERRTRRDASTPQDRDSVITKSIFLRNHIPQAAAHLNLNVLTVQYLLT